MLSRQAALKALESAYRARASGNKEVLSQHWAEGAHFEIVGKQDLMGGVPLKSGAAMHTVGALIDQFRLTGFEILDAVVEGNKVAARSRITVEVAGKPPEDSQLFDLVEFDDDGKICSFIQFADTALIRHMAA